MKTKDKAATLERIGQLIKLTENKLALLKELRAAIIRGEK